MKRKILALVITVVMLSALAVPALASSNNQVVVDPDTRVWQDGFGFHCNVPKGNGATAVEYIGESEAIENSIARLKKQPAGSMIVEKGDQKDIFGTRTFPVLLERVGTTTTWNLMTDDIECNTCGRIDWVTYSNNSGVINGRNIQVHHSATPRFPEPPVDFFGSFSFTKVKYDGYYLNGFQDVAVGEFTFNLFEIVDGEEVFVEAFTNDMIGVVTIADLAPGSYVLREVPNLLWDELRLSILRASGMMQHGDYNLVWNPAVVYIEVDVRGNVTLSGDIKDGIVNNVVACKHNMLWYEHSGYTQWMEGVTNVNTPHPNGGEIVDFTGYCNGILLPTYVEHAEIVYLICSLECGIGSIYDKNPEPPVELLTAVSFTKVKYGGELRVGADEFGFELFNVDTDTLIGTYYTDVNGVVTADIKAPGSYVFKEVIAVDFEKVPNGHSYRFVWSPIYPGGDDGLYFEVDAEGKVTWKHGDNPVVNNEYACKHKIQWTPDTAWEGYAPAYMGGFLLYGGCASNFTFDEARSYGASCNTPGVLYYECKTCQTGDGAVLPGNPLGCDMVTTEEYASYCGFRGYKTEICSRVECQFKVVTYDENWTEHVPVPGESDPHYLYCALCKNILGLNPDFIP